MVTLRTYSNPAEAALAKSLLDDRNIVCSLADENANLYGGGPLAMQVRLLVAEDQADEAQQILNTTHPLPDDVDPIATNDEASIVEPASQQILSELRGLHHTNQWIVLITLAVLVIAIYLVSELPRRATTPWSKVDEAMHNYDYATALTLAKQNLARNPNAYYAHAYLGNIYFEMGDLDRAETEYSRARELSPPHYLEERLKAVRERREREARHLPSATPTPRL